MRYRIVEVYFYARRWRAKIDVTDDEGRLHHHEICFDHEPTREELESWGKECIRRTEEALKESEIEELFTAYDPLVEYEKLKEAFKETVSARPDISLSELKSELKKLLPETCLDIEKVVEKVAIEAGGWDNLRKKLG